MQFLFAEHESKNCAVLDFMALGDEAAHAAE